MLTVDHSQSVQASTPCTSLQYKQAFSCFCAYVSSYMNGAYCHSEIVSGAAVLKSRLRVASPLLTVLLLIGAWRASSVRFLCLGYRWGFSSADLWTPLNSGTIVKIEKKKANERGGLYSSDPLGWVSMATGYDCLHMALTKSGNLGIRCAGTHILIHNPTYLWTLLFDLI